jgi:hypothetical protein
MTVIWQRVEQALRPAYRVALGFSPRGTSVAEAACSAPS